MVKGRLRKGYNVYLILDYYVFRRPETLREQIPEIILYCYKFSCFAITFVIIVMAQHSDITVWLVLTVCTLVIGSSMTCGYHYGVLTGPSQFVKDFYNQTNVDRYGSSLTEYGEAWLWAATITVFCVGRIVGAVTGAKWSRKFGRSRTLIGNSMISIVTSILMGSSQAAGSPELLILGRAVKGFDVGVALTVVPVYLKDISPRRRQSSICRLHQILFTVGIVIGQIMGFFVFYDERIWPGALGLPALLDLFQIVLLLFCPESPDWLLHDKFAEEKAAGALRQLRGEEEVDQEIQSLRDDHRSEARIIRASAWEVVFLRDTTWKMPLLMCILLQVGRQLSGVNAIIFYSTEIFLLAGLTDRQIALASLAWAVVFSTVTAFECFANISRFQRRPILLSAYALLTLSATAFTLFSIFEYRVSWLSWFAVVAMCVFFIAFPLGPALLTQLVCSELWSVGPRKAALSVTQHMSWWMDAIMQFIFPVLLMTIGAYTFVIFAASLAFVTLIIFLYLPETKDRRFVEISTGFEAMKCPSNDELEQSFTKYQEGYSPLPLVNR